MAMLSSKTLLFGSCLLLCLQYIATNTVSQGGATRGLGNDETFLEDLDDLLQRLKTVKRMTLEVKLRDLLSNKGQVDPLRNMNKYRKRWLGQASTKGVGKDLTKKKDSEEDSNSNSSSNISWWR